MFLHAIRQNDRMDLVTCIDVNVSNTVNVIQDGIFPPHLVWVLVVFLLYSCVIIVSFISAVLLSMQQQPKTPKLRISINLQGHVEDEQMNRLLIVIA